MTTISPKVLTPLAAALPAKGALVDSGALLDSFLDLYKERGLSLYAAQEEAILALYNNSNVILNTPTGSGKSLVATALHFHALAHGQRSFYTCPIKALVNEKFLTLCQEFGAEHVGMITGDASVNSQAPIICCTAEILANMALRGGADTEVDVVIMDEFHYYSDRERGAAWQIPLLTMSNARFLLMSATLGDTTFFEKALSDLTGQETLVVRSSERPVPLNFVYQETLLHETIKTLLSGGKAPIYLVNFTQRQCAEEAQNLLSVDVCSKEEKAIITSALQGVRFSSPYGKELQRLLRHGIGMHHAGLLPKYRLLVEQLAQRGLLKVICGTDTLGVGVNVPIRTVLFTRLCKFDGKKTSILSVRDFQQISGRAGRKGYDNQGTVVVQAPEHIVENLSMENKAAGDPRKLKKIVKKKPPEKGYVHWDINTFNRLISAPAEPLVSSFQVSHAMLLHTLSRDGDGCRAMKNLIRNCHETPAAKKTLMKTGFQMFRSLVERQIIRFEWLAEYRHKKILVDSDLQNDFSLNQSLSLYLLDTLKLLEPSAEDFALDALTLVESILENPEPILRKQLDRIKTIKMAEMKAEGIEYDERIAELERLEYPKPNREFIYESFNQFSAKHPWVGQENIRPKSIAREMYESFFSFDEYVRDYDNQRVEGLLLRYLSDAYKVMSQTVPESYRNDELTAIIDYLGSLIRSVDSSLLDEWEKLRQPGAADAESAANTAAAEPLDITRDQRRFTILIRNEVFRLVRALAAGDWEAALSLLEMDSEHSWTVSQLQKRAEAYAEDHIGLRTDRQARHPQNCRILADADNKGWQVEQILVDEEEANDWQIVLHIDREKSKAQERPVMSLRHIGPIGDWVEGAHNGR